MVARSLVNFVDENSASSGFIRRRDEIKDLILYRIGRIGLQQTIDSLRPDLWEIEIPTLEKVTSSSRISEVLRLLQESQENLEHYQDEYTPHALHAFEIYKKTITGILQRRSATQPFQMHVILDLAMPYDTILSLSKMSHWAFRYLAAWADRSLDIDIGFMILSMHRQKAIILDQDEFIRFLRTAAEYFGAYAAVLDIWQIPDEDESQPIRNTKIVAAMLRSNIDLPRPSYTIQELKTMLIGDEV